MLALLAMAAATTTAMAGAAARAQEEVRAHMEGCLLWSGPGAIAVRNDCSRPVALMLMTFADQQTVSTELAPGGRYASPFEWTAPGFMFTACPAGFQPSLRFAVENKEAIGGSLYNCVRGRPTS